MNVKKNIEEVLKHLEDIEFTDLKHEDVVKHAKACGILQATLTILEEDK